jgi:hypothetical protein
MSGLDSGAYESVKVRSLISELMYRNFIKVNFFNFFLHLWLSAYSLYFNMLHCGTIGAQQGLRQR